MEEANLSWKRSREALEDRELEFALEGWVALEK